MIPAAAIAAAWLVMWRTAWRLRAPLLRLGIGPRIANYLLICWRDLASAVAAIGLVGCVELWSGRNDLGQALSDIGLRSRVPAEELAPLSVLLFATCYAINLGFGLFRQAVRIGSTAATVNMVPDTPAETATLILILAPVSGVAEEIVFRGALMWGFITMGADQVSAVASQAVLFGIIHLYQGGLGVLRTAALGLVLGAGTLICGSLLPAMIAHALVNAAVGISRVPRGVAAKR